MADTTAYEIQINIDYDDVADPYIVKEFTDILENALMDDYNICSFTMEIKASK